MSKPFLLLLVTVGILVTGFTIAIIWALLPEMHTIGIVLVIILGLGLAGFIIQGWRLLGKKIQAQAQKNWREQHVIYNDAEGNAPHLIEYSQDRYSFTMALLRAAAPEKVAALLPPPNYIESINSLPHGHAAHPARNTYNYREIASRLAAAQPQALLPAPPSAATIADDPGMAPALAGVITLGDLLEQQIITPAQEQMLIGLRENRDPWWGSWELLYSFMIFGGSGGGKSSLVAYYCAQAVFGGARFLVIDPHADAGPESLTARLKPLEFALLSPVAKNAAGARRVLKIARQELEERLQGRGGKNALILITDELADIIEDSEQEGNEWGQVVEELKAVIKKFARSGRKRGCFAISISQVANAEAVGGTELRDVMTATFLTRMKKKQAQMVASADVAARCEQLNPKMGQFLIWPTEGQAEQITVPYARTVDLAAVGTLMFDLYKRWYPDIAQRYGDRQYHYEPQQQLVDYAPEAGMSTGSRYAMPPLPPRTESKAGANAGLYVVPRSDEEAFDEAETDVLGDPTLALILGNLDEDLHQKAQDVYDLYLRGVTGKVQVIREVWGAKAGGTTAYKTAEKEFDTITRIIQAAVEASRDVSRMATSEQA